MKGFRIGEVASIVKGELFGPGGAEATGLVIDSRAVEPGFIFAALPGERTDGHDYIEKAFAAGASACLALRVPEGESRPVIVVRDVACALGVLAEACRKTLAIPIIGVTGSVGKTTAKEMIAGVLSRRYNTLKTDKNFNNELGVPLTLFRIGPEHEAAVIEMGISRFGEMSKLAKMVRPDAAVFTKIGRAHLEALRDRDGVLLAKAEMLDYMPEETSIFVNGDDDLLWSLPCRQDKITFGLGEDCAVRAENIRVFDGEETACDIVSDARRIPVRIPAFGRHLVYAALAAAAVGMGLGLEDGEIAEGIAAYAPVGRRARVVRTKSLTIIDDCYNANPDSVESAVDSASDLPGRLVCILGDMLELGGDAAALHQRTGRYAQSKGALLLTVGELSKSMGGRHFDSKAELIAALPKLLEKSDNVLVKASHSMAFEEISEALEKLEIQMESAAKTETSEGYE